MIYLKRYIYIYFFLSTRKKTKKRKKKTKKREKVIYSKCTFLLQFFITTKIFLLITKRYETFTTFFFPLRLEIFDLTIETFV